MMITTTYSTMIRDRVLYIYTKPYAERIFIYNSMNSRLDNNIRLLLKCIKC